MNASAVRAAFAALPPLTASDDFWTVRRAGLRVNVANEPLEGFLRWPSIVGTMFVAQPEYVEPEWAALLAADPARWTAATSGEFGGAPNTNLIHQAYHLHAWETATGRNVAELRSIVEIGGGYGALARVARRAGFTGTYTIYDLPEVSLLQRYYLAECGVAAECRSEWAGPIVTDLFVALFSMSEMSIAQQAPYLAGLQAAHYLLGLQAPDWQGEDTGRLLEGRFGGGERVGIDHQTARYYLIG